MTTRRGSRAIRRAREFRQIGPGEEAARRGDQRTPRRRRGFAQKVHRRAPLIGAALPATSAAARAPAVSIRRARSRPCFRRTPPCRRSGPEDRAGFGGSRQRSAMRAQISSRTFMPSGLAHAAADVGIAVRSGRAPKRHAQDIERAEERAGIVRHAPDDTPGGVKELLGVAHLCDSARSTLRGASTKASASALRSPSLSRNVSASFSTTRTAAARRPRNAAPI